MKIPARFRALPAAALFLFLPGVFTGAQEMIPEIVLFPETAVSAFLPAERPLRKTPYLRPARLAGDRGKAGAADFEPSSLSPFAASGLEDPLTQRYISQYTSPGGIAWLNSVIKRGGLFIPFIRQEIAARKLPPELIYLPVIESGFFSDATSRSGAMGLWQFMRNSIGPFDMKINEWMDERRDFWKATQGALAKLEDNYRSLGDWALALAAYNAGLGGVSRVVSRTGIRDYWTLCRRGELRNETVHYVPKLIAVSRILSDPRHFGIDAWPEGPDWTRVPAGRTADLDIIAEAAGMEKELLRNGNRELLRGITPPDRNYMLKVPAEYAGAVAAVLERQDLKFINYYYYVIRFGDTLSALSRHYDVSVELIRDTNPGLNPRYLKIGQEIRIPALRDVDPYRRGGGGGGEELVFGGNHIVKKGETLWAIAIAFQVDPETLAEANGMELNGTLREGRSLKVPIR
ncbi:MAG: LysM peptidoglycan-binding domain-containing protein [Treponema sp.]|jgi:membrane-bound lytic murein transglycosylase D|nr:LysM peptidoglycan-binding domain-containing protein [Treponema sp.]